MTKFEKETDGYDEGCHTIFCIMERTLLMGLMKDHRKQQIFNKL